VIDHDARRPEGTLIAVASSTSACRLAKLRPLGLPPRAGPAARRTGDAIRGLVRATNEGDDLNATGFFKAVLPVDPGAAAV